MAKASLLFIQSNYGKPSKMFNEVAKQDNSASILQTELNIEHLRSATGLITSMHLDQIGMMEFSKELEEFLKRGGRWFFNGHLMRPLVFGLKNYEYINEEGKESLQLTQLANHPIFDGINRDSLAERKGVAGFYGRGHNPMPKGAIAITGVGRKQAAVDWVWKTPYGGEIFSHAGNDLQGTASDKKTSLRLINNIISWTMRKENL